MQLLVVSKLMILSLLKMCRERSINKNLKDCNCSEFPSYINGEAPFFCSEDKIVSVNEVQELIVSISEVHL